MMTTFSSPTPPPAGTHDDDGVIRDWNGRYVLPLPDGGKWTTTKEGAPIGKTRVSTLTHSLSDQTGIRIAEGGKIIEGLAKSDQLMADAIKAAAIEDETARKKATRKVAVAAIENSSATYRRELGTAFHAYTERANRGEQLPPPPEHVQVDVTAYYQLLAENNIRPVREYLERVVDCPHGYAGKIDNLVWWLNPDTEQYELLVGDCKTGADLERGWLEIELQLWEYANMERFWIREDGAPNGGHWEPRPAELRRDKALIFHIPQNGTARLELIDLGGVGDWVYAAVVARRANAEAKHKVRTVATVDLRGPAHTGTTLPVGVIACGPVPPSAEDMAVVQEFAEQLQSKPVTPAGVLAPAQPSVLDHAPEFPGQVTPQMLADAAKADERRAAAGVNGPVKIGGTMTVTTDELAANPRDPLNLDIIDTLTMMNGEGKPLAPLAEPGKKGCSVCRRTGHRKGSKACLGADDPVAVGVTEVVTVSGQDDDGVPTREQVERPADTRTAPRTEEARQNNVRALELLRQQVEDAGVQYHDDVSGSHTPSGWTPGAEPEQWVCAICGLPSRAAEEQRLARAAGTPVHLNELPTVQSDASVPPGTSYHLPDAAPVPAAWPPPVAPEPEDAWILRDIASAAGRTAVGNVRVLAMNRGQWNEAVHAPAAIERYYQLPENS